MKIQDYLHLYLGCQVQYDDAYTGTLVGVNKKIKPSYAPAMIETEWALIINREYSKIKPLLRPLSDMTEEEYRKAISILKDIEHINKGATRSRFIAWVQGDIRFSGTCKEFVNLFYYLLSKGFDLFGLIDAGLALPRLINS